MTCRVEFGTIMLWYYTVDRTSLFSYGKKVDCTYRLLSWELDELTELLTGSLAFWDSLLRHIKCLNFMNNAAYCRWGGCAAL